MTIWFLVIVVVSKSLAPLSADVNLEPKGFLDKEHCEATGIAATEAINSILPMASKLATSALP